MSKRIIADVTYRSKKVRAVHPPEFRPEYAWIMPMFADNGVCEYDPGFIWTTAYSLSRPGWTEEQVQTVIDEFVRVGLYLKYEAEGKAWLYLVGSDKAGHLPPPSQRHSTLPLPSGYPEPSPNLTLALATEQAMGLEQEQVEAVVTATDKAAEPPVRSSVTTTLVNSKDVGETPTTPIETQKLNWAKAHKFWKKFTSNPKSFRKGCLDSEEFNQQFADREPAKRNFLMDKIKQQEAEAEIDVEDLPGFEPEVEPDPEPQPKPDFSGAVKTDPAGCSIHGKYYWSPTWEKDCPVCNELHRPATPEEWKALKKRRPVPVTVDTEEL